MAQNEAKKKSEGQNPLDNVAPDKDGDVTDTKGNDGSSDASDLQKTAAKLIEVVRKSKSSKKQDNK